MRYGSTPWNETTYHYIQWNPNSLNKTTYLEPPTPSTCTVEPVQSNPMNPKMRPSLYFEKSPAIRTPPSNQDMKLPGRLVLSIYKLLSSEPRSGQTLKVYSIHILGVCLHCTVHGLASCWAIVLYFYYEYASCYTQYQTFIDAAHNPAVQPDLSYS